MLTEAPAIPGLVWAYHIDAAKGVATRLPTSQPADTLLPQEGFLWLHLNLADIRVPGFVEQFPGLTEAARAALLNHEHHAALSVDEQLIFGTLVDFQREFDSTTRDFGWLHFALSDRFIITTRVQPIRSVDLLRGAIEKNPAKFASPMQVYEVLVAEFQRGIIQLVLELTDEINRIEDVVYGEDMRDERTRLAPVRRVIVRLHRHLRGMLSLMRRAAAVDDDEMPSGFEDVAFRLINRLESADHDVYALHERARLLHEEIDSKQTSETNRHLYVLSLMTAFLLPPSLVTGFFGMNTSHLPFTTGPEGWIYATGLMLGSILLAWLVLRRANIL
ncbi:transporter [Rhizobium paknamense]|uniref:Zinc transporter n=1 Tax=Rhizobium paknamense TaxID=1206817 RepID=A0ABU0IA12_9HYPH|nr:transporter [Rhizobium paknamense]MDQ0455051.1 zinc transporter [Rhizobium paknamense]